MNQVELACTGCEKVYKVPVKKIPEKGAKTKCKQCNTPIVIQPAHYYAKHTVNASVITSTKTPEQAVRKPSPQKPVAQKKTSATTDDNQHAHLETAASNQSRTLSTQQITVSDTFKNVTVSARAKSEEVKSRAFEELNKLEDSNRSSLIIVLSTCIFFLLAKLLNNVYFVGAVFDRLIAIFFLLFFIFVVMGCVKGIKKEVVVYYDKKDVFNAFKILGSLIVTFLGFSIAMSAILGSELANSGPVNLINVILCVTVPSYFLYLSIADALYHNQHESVVNKVSAICAKIGIGILYPLVILHEMSNIGTHTTVDGYGNKTTRHHSPVFLIIFMALGGALIWKLINGQTVYAKRDTINTPNDSNSTVNSGS